MKRAKTVLTALLLAGAIGSANVSASDGHGGHHHGGHSHTSASLGFVFGGPGYWPYYGPPAYPYPYYYPYYYPPTITVPYSPPVYVERGSDEMANEQYWYFCSNPRGYYPYIRNCNTNWQRVTPTPNRN